MNRARKPHRTPWPAICDALSSKGAALPAPRPASAFWDEFHARRGNDVPETSPHPGALYWQLFVSRPILMPAAAACGALLLLAAAWFGIFSQRGSRGVIQSYDVSVPHRAVLILDTPGAQASILWVEGMEPTANGSTGT